MSFSKANDLKKAEKLVQQGKIAAAIKEYSNLVAANPNDLTLINTLGDLCVREGRIDDAILYFTKIGENYTKNGFTLKAIAMYKKVYKLAPNNPEIAYKLAELYSKQGLVVDARKQYMEVADAYTRAGRTQQALDVLRKIADLDPENVSVRLKLADSYQRERMNDQAHEAYVAAGSQLLRKGNLDESQQAFMKALSVDPSSKPALSSLANIFTQQGDPQKAVSMLLRVTSNKPDDPDLVTLLGRTYLGANMLDDAEKTFLKLLDIDKARYEYLLQIARKFVDLGQFDRAVGLVDACMEIMVTRRQESRAVDILGTITELDPYHLKAHQCLKTLYSRLGEDHNLGSALQGVVEAALHHNDTQLAGEALRQLAELEPDNPSHRNRLNALGLDAAVSPTIAVRDKAVSSPLQPGVGGSVNFQFGGEVYPTSGGDTGFGFTSGTGFTSGAGFAPPSVSPAGFGAESAPFGGGFTSGTQFQTGNLNDVQKRIVDADRFASRGYADKAAEILEEVLVANPHSLDARLKLREIYLNGGLTAKAADQCAALARIYDAGGDAGQAQAMLAEAFTLNPSVQLPDFGGPIAGYSPAAKASGDSIEIDISDGFDGSISGSFQPPTFTVAPPPPPPPPPPLVDHFYGGAPHPTAADYGGFSDFGANFAVTPGGEFQIPTTASGSFATFAADQHLPEGLREELEGVDFYLNQGYHDLASETLKRLDAQYPNHPEVQSRTARLAPPPPPPPVREASPFDLSNLMAPPPSAPSAGFADFGASGMGFEVSVPSSFAPPPPPPMPMPPPMPPPQVVSVPPAHLPPAAPEPPPIASGPDDDLFPFAGPPSVDSLISSLITDLGDSLEGLVDDEAAKRITGAHQAASPAPVVSSGPPQVANRLEESGLQDIFDEFKHSIEMETEEEAPDFETHYNLGLAYKDMELLDEAVEEFQTAIKSTESSSPDGRYFQSCNMLGLCFMAKGMAQPAAVWFKRGLDAPGRSEDEYQAMRFDLGLAFEAQGKYEQALELFETVYALDINYREVGDKVKEIKEKLKK